MRYLLKAPKSEYTQVYVCNSLCCLQTRSSKRVLLIFTALQMVLFSMCLFIAHTLPILQASLPNIICTPFCARFCQFFSFSAMFCHLNFCQMMLPQFSTLQSLPYFNFILIFCHLIFFYIVCFYQCLQREKSDVPFARSGFLLANNAFFSQLLFISHNFALLFSLGMRQGPKDLKLT